MDARQLLAGRDPDQLAHTRELGSLRRLERETERRRVGDRIPHASVGDVDRERAEALYFERRRRAGRQSRHVRQLDALALPFAQRALTSMTPAGASSRRVVSGSRISTIPVSSSTVATQIAFEPDIGGYSVGSMMMNPASQSAALRRDDQVRVNGDAAARLAQQQLAQRVVGSQRLHLLEDRGARRRQDAADDDVPDLAAGVAADDGDQRRPGISPPFR